MRDATCATQGADALYETRCDAQCLDVRFAMHVSPMRDVRPR